MSKSLPLLSDSEIYSKIFTNSSAGQLDTNVSDEEAKFNDKDLWDIIITEYDNKRAEYEEYMKSKSKTITLPNELVKDTVWGFMDSKVFPMLIPALNSMMFKAQKWNAVKERKSRFNGLDHMAELLWNFNPKYPDRHKNYTDIYDIPFVIDHLKDNPRTIFRKSEIWTRNYAAIVLQSYYRGHLVRREEEVQQMRLFWKQYREDVCERLNVVALGQNTESNSRRLSTRLQCFCDMNSIECINAGTCDLKVSTGDEISEETTNINFIESLIF